MKFLLTSTGIANETIKNKFLAMVCKQPKDISLAYIPTAINVASVQDKRWAVDNIVRLSSMGVGVIDIVDFSAIPKDLWLPRLKNVDVLFVEGGTLTYLLDEIRKAGLDKLLTTEFSDKVYVGCSAGSVLLGEIAVKSAKDIPEGYKAHKGLGMVKFSIRPHFYRPDRTQFNEEMIAELAKKYNSTFYAIDDDTAIAVEDDQIEVVSEGRWKKFESKQ